MKNLSKKASLRTPLGRVRGHGSAKHGTGHWWGMKLTSLALLFLGLWFVASLIAAMVGYGYPGAIHWIINPVNATLLVLLLLAMFRHSEQGLQVVIEDYINHEGARIGALLLSKALHLILLVVATLATLQIFFGP